MIKVGGPVYNRLVKMGDIQPSITSPERLAPAKPNINMRSRFTEGEISTADPIQKEIQKEKLEEEKNFEKEEIQKGELEEEELEEEELEEEELEEGKLEESKIFFDFEKSIKKLILEELKKNDFSYSDSDSDSDTSEYELQSEYF